MGRLRLGDGQEGGVPKIAAVDGAHEVVAGITVSALALDTEERRERHLLRRASLLGCDAVTPIEHQTERSTTLCLRRREPMPMRPAELLVVVSPSQELRQRALASGPSGLALVRVLEQSEHQPAEQRAWPLQWFLSHYPDSPFTADVLALLATAAATSGPGAPPAAIHSAQAK